MRLGSLQAAVQHSARLAAVALAVGVLGTLALRAAGRAAARRAVTPAADSAPAGFNLFAAAAAAALRPSQVLLPYCTGGYLLTLGASLAQVAATRRPKDFSRLCCELGVSAGWGKRECRQTRAGAQQPRCACLRHAHSCLSALQAAAVTRCWHSSKGWRSCCR